MYVDACVPMSATQQYGIGHFMFFENIEDQQDVLAGDSFCHTSLTT